MAEERKVRAQIMKQYRMFNEEKNEDNKRTTEREKGAGEGGGSGPSGKKK